MNTTLPTPLEHQIDGLSRALRLPHLRRIAPELLATARSQRWDPAEVVRVLLEEEVTGREAAGKAIRRDRAGFPAGKTFDAWRETDSSIPIPTQSALQTLEWIGRHENLCLCGPSGTGKSHFVEALGQKAIDQGMRVSWFTFESLGALIRRHRVDDTVAKAIDRVVRVELIVIDEIGQLPAKPEEAEAFYRVIDAAYEKRSVAVTSNHHPAGFDQIMPKTLATAAVDRLLHHAHIVVTEGDSLRLVEARQGKGVKPLQ
jgi:DNA replication protein DnaC